MKTSSRAIILAGCFLTAPFAAAEDSVSAPPSPVMGVAKTLRRSDLVFHYKDYGAGVPVLVLMGGPGVPGEGMEPVARIIAKRGRAIVPDQRGAGKSMPEKTEAITLDATLADFEALRQELGLSKWTVWGCSWGGSVALEYASKFPASLQGLVLVGSGGPSRTAYAQAFADNMNARMSPDDRSARAYWSRSEVVARDPERAAVEVMRAIIPSGFYDRAKAQEAIAIFKPGKEYYNPDAARYLRPAFDQGAVARAEALARVEIPTLIIHGRQDYIPESVALANQSLIKGSRLVWIERCGHWPWIEQPAALEKALFEFLFPEIPKG